VERYDTVVAVVGDGAEQEAAALFGIGVGAVSSDGVENRFGGDHRRVLR
jgi:hypothetical protein